MNHLSPDELVLSYYGEPGLGAGRAEHLQQCDVCRDELASLSVFLDRVTPAEVEEPAGDYEARTWDRLQWRLRGQRRTSGTWKTWLAAAAMIALAFLGGALWKSSTRRVVTSSSVATTTTAPSVDPAAHQLAESKSRDRVLLVVVGEHMGQSERVLIELTNLTASGSTDITTERDRAQDLLASNRLYRTSALQRGEESVATLLDELEPVLLQIAHAPDQVSAEELRAIQKRVEAKGLVFKLRVVRADVDRDTAASTRPTNI
ncbi:MAG: hypothetical protein ABI779_23990 [Acidobacteriota bacterium]